MDDSVKQIKTLTINGTKYKLRGSVETLKCGEISISADNTGTADLSPLFTRVDTLTPVSVAGVLNNAELEKSIVKAVSSNFTNADTTSY